MALVRLVDPATFTDGGLDVVRRVTDAADAADGVESLNEHARLHLKHHGLQHASLWLGEDGAGFALVHDGDQLDVVVRPDARGRGVGGRLVASALSSLTEVEAWSHADHPAAARLAARHGVPRARELHVMSRPTASPLEVPAPPDGVHVRGYTAADAEAVVALNRAAFAHHPEQGEMTLADFAERTGEAWFDPAGLFLAVGPDDDLLGFHWTKLHRDAAAPFGEVYVVAVAPDAAGRGLGTLLTAVGLQHLAGAGVAEVVLYVEGDNAPALAVYRRLGFVDARVEAQYRGVVAHPA